MKTLKKIALIFIILSTGVVFIPEKANAQNELQFSQVLTYAGTISVNYSPTYTVPSNKVWKVEMISTPNDNFRVYVNDLNIFYVSDVYPVVFFPIWLKAGDNIKIWYSEPINYFFSIIEYSVVAIQ